MLKQYKQYKQYKLFKGIKGVRHITTTGKRDAFNILTGLEENIKKYKRQSAILDQEVRRFENTLCIYQLEVEELWKTYDYIIEKFPEHDHKREYELNKLIDQLRGLRKETLDRYYQIDLGIKAFLGKRK